MTMENKMKMLKTHYDIIKDAIASLPREQVLAHKKLKLGKDIDKRFRYDLLYACKLSNWVCDELYLYLNDDHIDTALKSIVKELNYN